ncbi:MAG TPA: hypothetical protein VMT29_15990 [Steroidobacteraceae bacterium]|nr:hypothetical protein [Steroidobacteraceae bacterium]
MIKKSGNIRCAARDSPIQVLLALRTGRKEPWQEKGATRFARGMAQPSTFEEAMPVRYSGAHLLLHRGEVSRRQGSGFGTDKPHLAHRQQRQW